jgi:predicted DNA-binding protein
MAGSPLSIRLPEETRKKMKELDIDWADYIRTAIEAKIRELQRKKAAESMDKIRAKTKLGAFDSTRSIREDRDAAV